MASEQHLHCGRRWPESDELAASDCRCSSCAAKRTAAPVAASALLASVPPCRYTHTHSHTPIPHHPKACPRLQNWLATAGCPDSLPLRRLSFPSCSPSSPWLISLKFCCGPRSIFPHNRPASSSLSQPRAACLERQRARSAPDQTNLPLPATQGTGVPPLSYNDQLHPGCCNSQSYRRCPSPLALLIRSVAVPTPVSSQRMSCLRRVTSISR
jgi:hypothetical protein